MSTLQELPGRSRPDWYPDPVHTHEYRYFDGSQWTRYVADDGRMAEEAGFWPPPPVPTEPRASAQQSEADEEGADLDTVRKRFRGLGYLVGLLGLMSLFFLEGAPDGLVGGTMLAVVLCVAAGVWLVARPSTAAGVTAGAALVLLGFFDIALAVEADVEPFAAIVDGVVALNVFVATARYARASHALPVGSPQDG
jgi:hypothetical protein